MSETLDDKYLDWLYGEVGFYESNVYHYELMKEMHAEEFVWSVPNDDNRCADGIALRMQFVKAGPMVRPDDHWLYMGCSFLEMLIGVAHRLAFEAEGEPGEWVWHLTENLGLARYDDRRFNARRVNEIMERVIWRTYSANGNGGLFPLENPREDQRRVEIWTQLNAYILEMS